MRSRLIAKQRGISVLVGARTTMACQLLRRALGNSSGGLRVIASAVDCADLLYEVQTHRPDIAIISDDLQDGPGAGFKALKGLQNSGAATRVIMLLDHSDKEEVLEAFGSGARAVFCQTVGVEALRKCVKCVYDGQIWADTAQMEVVLGALAESRPRPLVNEKGAQLLTKRENEVVGMVATGFTNEEISSRLQISVHTVRNHLFRIYEKLGISSRAELIFYALSHRWKSNGANGDVRKGGVPSAAASSR